MPSKRDERSRTIEVYRQTGYWMDRNRQYKVHLDGKHVGDVRRHSAATYSVSPGTHVLRVHIDILRSNPLSVKL